MNPFVKTNTIKLKKILDPEDSIVQSLTRKEIRYCKVKAKKTDQCSMQRHRK